MLGVYLLIIKDATTHKELIVDVYDSRRLAVKDLCRYILESGDNAPYIADEEDAAIEYLKTKGEIATIQRKIVIDDVVMAVQKANDHATRVRTENDRSE